MVIPCYLSNSTYGEVTIIRTALHDALDSNNQGNFTSIPNLQLFLLLFIVFMYV